MPFKAVKPASGPTRHIIVHNDGVKTTALTIDCASKENLETVYSSEILRLYERGLIESHDESRGFDFHNRLHQDMQQAMGVTAIDSLTDFHQHWVDKNAQPPLLSSGTLVKILNSFKSKTWITSNDLKVLMEAIVE